MPNFIFIATSLDGYIARRNGDIDWLMSIDNPERDDYGYNAFINTIDAIVMGSGTFKIVQGFKTWPYRIPVYVLTAHAGKLGHSFMDMIVIVQEDPVKLTTRLNHSGHRNLYIDGGNVIQAFLREELIDEMIITRLPVLLGSGIPLFGSLNQDMHWTHVKTNVFKNGLVQSQYRKHD
jgi:dihydrofolate reductase